MVSIKDAMCLVPSPDFSANTCASAICSIVVIIRTFPMHFRRHDLAGSSPLRSTTARQILASVKSANVRTNLSYLHVDQVRSNALYTALRPGRDANQEAFPGHTRFTEHCCHLDIL